MFASCIFYKAIIVLVISFIVADKTAVFYFFTEFSQSLHEKNKKKGRKMRP